MNLARNTGRAAEERAANYLQNAGLRLLARNWRCRRGELDLVMQHDATLVIVEVRARSHAGYGGALGSIDHRKQQRIARAATAYLSAHPELAQLPVRFDVIAYQGDANVQWLRDAFQVET